MRGIGPRIFLSDTPNLPACSTAVALPTITITITITTTAHQVPFCPLPSTRLSRKKAWKQQRVATTNRDASTSWPCLARSSIRSCRSRWR